MKKRISIAIGFVILLSLIGCEKFDDRPTSNIEQTPTTLTEDSNKLITEEDEEEEEVKEEDEDLEAQVVAVLDINREYLNKYRKASSNKNIGLFGLDEEFETIEEKSEEAEEATANCIDLLAEQGNMEGLEKFYSDIILINKQLEEENGKMKEAKRSIDIDSLTITLEDLTGILDDYIVILQQFDGGV